jgi:hypothetical protein
MICKETFGHGLCQNFITLPIIRTLELLSAIKNEREWNLGEFSPCWNLAIIIIFFFQPHNPSFPAEGKPLTQLLFSVMAIFFSNAAPLIRTITSSNRYNRQN